MRSHRIQPAIRRVSAMTSLCHAVLLHDIIAEEGHIIPAGSKGIILTKHADKPSFEVSFTDPEPSVAVVQRVSLASVDDVN